ncbi:NAD(P)/FAD-dependent oxidoreductase [Nesterenkonia sp. F]|uniref:FAD-dependent oxidoreductase n=1 Tax=Nesterenkonia sp. F TaxID=795955 RepID=UPI000255C966|nr:NAD(P)/FAD-dependent oxidoreductase [Nesterenkonia sp. F]
MPRGSTDVLVVGAGLAGLHTAAQLARRGHDVVLVDRRRRLTEAIRTTGIFVRRTLEDYDLPEDCLGPPIRRMVLHPPSHRDPVDLVSTRDEFRVGDMPRLYARLHQQALDAGARVLLGMRRAGLDAAGRQVLRRVSAGDGSGGSTSGGDGEELPAELRLDARFLVGADGARSQVARDLGLDRNRHLLIGAETVGAVADVGQMPAFRCVVDPRIAPGYLAWAVDDGVHSHVGTAGRSDRFTGGVRAALERFAAEAPGPHGRPAAETLEHRAGPIPVGGLLRRIGAPGGLLVGDAAGAVSPLTAGGLDPCLRLSDHAVELLDEALSTGDRRVLRGYDGAALRRRFRGRLALRQGLESLRGPAAAEAAFLGLRSAPGVRPPGGSSSATGPSRIRDRPAGDRRGRGLSPARPPASGRRRRRPPDRPESAR